MPPPPVSCVIKPILEISNYLTVHGARQINCARCYGKQIRCPDVQAFIGLYTWLSLPSQHPLPLRLCFGKQPRVVLAGLPLPPAPAQLISRSCYSRWAGSSQRCACLCPLWFVQRLTQSKVRVFIFKSLFFFLALSHLAGS